MNEIQIPDTVRRRVERVLGDDEDLSEWLTDAARLRLNVENSDELIEDYQ